MTDKEHRRLRRRLSSALLTLPALAFVACAHAQDSPGFVERFDALVDQGLPATLPMPPPAMGTQSRAQSVLRVTARLNSTATFPGEPPATLYDATLDGDAAVVTRSRTGLDVTAVTAQGAQVIAVTSGAATEHTLLPAASDPGTASAARAMPADFHDDVESGAGPMPLPSFADSTAPLAIRIFLHEELRSTQARSIHAGYVAWWLRDMETVVLPGEKIEVTYLQPVRGISDLPIGTEGTIADWARNVVAYRNSRGLRATWRNKYMLVTQRIAVPGRLGTALPASGAAIASLSGPYSVIAHELGHTFGAEHALAETRMGKWWGCRTTMSSPHLPLLANCYEYSTANMTSIRRHVSLKGHLPAHWFTPQPIPGSGRSAPLPDTIQ
ncbi:MAG TPA: hypothetical protein VN813_15505 [Luteibacter sp.]|nr:hypothetical protein [Luteibacter sp.]